MNRWKTDGQMGKKINKTRNKHRKKDENGLTIDGKRRKVDGK